MPDKKTIFILAGETSGDLHAAHLVKAIKKLNPHMLFCGAGGNLMREEGVEIFYNFVELAVVGFWEVVRNLKKFKEIFELLCKRLDEVKPDCVVLIDYPGFNLRFAREVKKRKIKLIYYISPQVWAWGKGRIALIKRYVDKMIVIFKFEEELYRAYAIDAIFVGHPLLDIVKSVASRNDLLEKFELSPNRKTIALLPGSRDIEIKQHLPLMLEVAGLVSQKMPQTQFLLSQSKNLPENFFSSYLKPYTLNLKTVIGNYDCIEASDLVLVASGTATLETAILEKPMLIIYKTSFLTWAWIKPQIRIPYIGLVNVVAGEKIVPEFIQYNARPHKIANVVLDLVDNPKKLEQIKEKLKNVKGKLGGPAAAERAARIILDFI